MVSLFVAWYAIFACITCPAAACNSTPCTAAEDLHLHLLPLDAEYEDGIGARYPREVDEAEHAEETIQEGLGAAEGEEELGGAVPPAAHGGRPWVWHHGDQSQGRGTSACGPDGPVLYVGRHARASHPNVSGRGEGHVGHRDLPLLGASVRHAYDTAHTAWRPKDCPEAADPAYDRACRIDEGTGLHVAAWNSIRLSTGGSGEAASSHDQCFAAPTEEGRRAASGTSWRRTRGARDEDMQEAEERYLKVYTLIYFRSNRQLQHGKGEERWGDAQMDRAERGGGAERKGAWGREEGLGPSNPITPVVIGVPPRCPRAAGKKPRWCSWAAHASPPARHALQDKHAAVCNIVALGSHVGRLTPMQKGGGVNKTICVRVLRRRGAAAEGAAAGKRRAALDPAVPSSRRSDKCLGPGRTVRPGLGAWVNACGGGGDGDGAPTHRCSGNARANASEGASPRSGDGQPAEWQPQQCQTTSWLKAASLGRRLGQRLPRARAERDSEGMRALCETVPYSLAPRTNYGIGTSLHSNASLRHPGIGKGGRGAGRQGGQMRGGESGNCTPSVSENSSGRGWIGAHLRRRHGHACGTHHGITQDNATASTACCQAAVSPEHRRVTCHDDRGSAILVVGGAALRYLEGKCGLLEGSIIRGGIYLYWGGFCQCGGNGHGDRALAAAYLVAAAAVGMLACLCTEGKAPVRRRRGRHEVKQHRRHLTRGACSKGGELADQHGPRLRVLATSAIVIRGVRHRRPRRSRAVRSGAAGKFLAVWEQRPAADQQGSRLRIASADAVTACGRTAPGTCGRPWRKGTRLFAFVLITILLTADAPDLALGRFRHAGFPDGEGHSHGNGGLEVARPRLEYGRGMAGMQLHGRDGEPPWATPPRDETVPTCCGGLAGDRDCQSDLSGGAAARQMHPHGDPFWRTGLPWQEPLAVGPPQAAEADRANGTGWRRDRPRAFAQAADDSGELGAGAEGSIANVTIGTDIIVALLRDNFDAGTVGVSDRCGDAGAVQLCMGAESPSRARLSGHSHADYGTMDLHRGVRRAATCDDDLRRDELICVEGDGDILYCIDVTTNGAKLTQRPGHAPWQRSWSLLPRASYGPSARGDARTGPGRKAIVRIGEATNPGPEHRGADMPHLADVTKCIVVERHEAEKLHKAADRPGFRYAKLPGMLDPPRADGKPQGEHFALTTATVNATSWNSAKHFIRSTDAHVLWGGGGRHTGEGLPWPLGSDRGRLPRPCGEGDCCEAAGARLPTIGLLRTVPPGRSGPGTGK